MLQVYKRGQGKYTRITTFLGAMFIAVVVAGALTSFLEGYAATRAPVVRFSIPTAVVIGTGLAVLWLVNRPKSADFLIATEGEMKKVSWSSKKEIVGSTKVVIITTFILAVVLFAVDIIFVFLFRWMDIYI